MEPAEKAPQDEEKRKRRPPLLAITLVRKVMDVSSISVEELSRRIHAGVLMNDNKLKFWVDLDCGKNCFLLLAKSIHGIDENGGNWTWIDEKEKCYEGEVSVQVAEMASVRWQRSQELSATFKTIMLSPKTTYSVEFVVKLREDSRRLRGRLNLSLTLPDGTRLECTSDLGSRAKGKWIHILVCTFETTPKNVGEITANCTLSDGWTNELIFKGIVLRPNRNVRSIDDRISDLESIQDRIRNLSDLGSIEDMIRDLSDSGSIEDRIGDLSDSESIEDRIRDLSGIRDLRSIKGSISNVRVESHSVQIHKPR